MSALPLSHTNKTRLSGNTALELYLKDIAQKDLLTPQKEKELAKRARSGDRKSINQMVESNLRFVITIAKDYQGRGLPLEELIAEGNVGLMRAVTRYDETLGVKFTTYAVWWIRQCILAALNEKMRLVRLPVNKIKDIGKLERIANKLKQELSRDPTIEELADQADMTPRHVQDLLNASHWHLSLDMPIGDHAETPMVDIIKDEEQLTPEDICLKQAIDKEAHAALDMLSPREARVLRLYFGINSGETMTLAQIGTILNLTKERVRQIRDKALTSLKRPLFKRNIHALLSEN